MDVFFFFPSCGVSVGFWGLLGGFCCRFWFGVLGLFLFWLREVCYLMRNGSVLREREWACHVGILIICGFIVLLNERGDF